MIRRTLAPYLGGPYRAVKSASSSVVTALLVQRARRKLHRFAAPYRLNVGCGTVRFDGWVNLDENASLNTVDVVWDLRRGLPVEDASCELIYCEHLLEHLTVEQGLTFLRECRRALTKAGVLRVAMPSLDVILERAVSDKWRDQDWLAWSKHGNVKTRAEMINVAFRNWGHQYLYDREELHRRLAEAGFSRVVDCEFGDSTRDELKRRETRPDSLLICEACQ